MGYIYIYELISHGLASRDPSFHKISHKHVGQIVVHRLELYVSCSINSCVLRCSR